jgi:uncharacterized membrane protein (UPF0127 family)
VIEMRQVKIINRTRGLKRPLTADYCQSFLCKLRGLALRRKLAAGRGLLLADGSESRLSAGIHMLGMFFDLTIVWLDKNAKVVDVRRARRWRSFLFPRKPACYVIECGVSRYEDFRIGDKLAFEN